MSIVVKPIFGMCNRLRFLFSYRKLAKKNNKQLIVIWEKTDDCPGFFLDYFEPLDGVIFKKKDKGKFEIDYVGFTIHNSYPPNYKKLKLLPFMQDIIQKKIRLLNKNYIACHIRRTDHIELAKQSSYYTNDNDFLHFIQKELQEPNTEQNVYIATDTKETYDKFNDFNKIKIPYHEVINGLRQTSLQDSIIDLYMCVYANKFMGSHYSSFSYLIEDLRQIMHK